MEACVILYTFAAIIHQAQPRTDDIICYIVRNTFLSHGWRKIWFVVFRWEVEWPSGNDGFRHWPWYWATDWSGHLASNWSWLKICKNPTFGHQKEVLAIIDSFSLDLSLQLLGWGPTRLVTTFGHQYKPWTTFFRHLFWGLLTSTSNGTFLKFWLRKVTALGIHL